METENITPAIKKITEDIKYREAFAFMSGYCLSAKKTNCPIDATKLFQAVYDNIGLLPSDWVVKDLGLAVKEAQL